MNATKIVTIALNSSCQELSKTVIGFFVTLSILCLSTGGQSSCRVHGETLVLFVN